ncbi:RidA family protein [Aminobacter aminovorans]|uniref:Enamine deaminase RidA (YjgF/YER057c/UK114 family) n=1 Tax=Aminobacter aminovorans TaxID=83263 RepID=A0AAC9FEU7_AMIAI|nr:RidA family protein [Aminobacter aminovorans]AMS45497.1 Endoribonuclease L-PSP [Aminobacter aminovorans]MBB3708705.1 enamine deaminase RidA (YjgF/YER057c/UK114 family) [Aminobacter aminovorans]
MVSADEGRLLYVQPEGWSRASGLSYGVVGEARRQLFIAGQIGGDTGASAPAHDAGFASQFIKALENVVTVVESAGGTASDIAALRIFVTSIDSFKTAQPVIAEAWRSLLGYHFPAMTMVQVSALYEATALVEIEGTALLKMEG